jgi:hypothetical protein
MDDVENSIQAALKHAENSGRRIVFPKARKLSDIFEQFEPVKDLSKYKSSVVKSWIVNDGYANGQADLSSFCSVRGFSPKRSHLDVVPQRATFEAIEQYMIMSDGYVINFEIAINREKTALISAHNNKITGSVLFAIIPASEIPD